MTSWVCRRCNSISYAHYETRRGTKTFLGWKCSECGCVEPAAIGPTKIKEEVRLPR